MQEVFDLLMNGNYKTIKIVSTGAIKRKQVSRIESVQMESKKICSLTTSTGRTYIDNSLEIVIANANEILLEQKNMRTYHGLANIQIWIRG